MPAPCPMPDQPGLFDAIPDAPEPAPADPPEAADAPDEAPPETLFLADAMALAYRAFFSMKNAVLTTPDGATDTRAVYGFATALLKLLEDHTPEHIAVVFDAAGDQGTFRSELYDGYKAHRPPMPDGIADAIPYIHRLVEAFDIPVVAVPGVEADDAIGTLACRAQAEGVDVVIFSPDKDFRQLLADRESTPDGPRGAVHMLRPPYMGETFERETPASFRARYGDLEPAQFVDLLALMGDTSDNVPGVPGIGEKTAVSLIQTYGSVENLLDHADEIKAKKAREGLQNHADDARLSRHLVQIACDVPLVTSNGTPLDWHALRRTDPDLEALDALFNELGFGGRLRSRVRDYAEGRQRRRADGRPGRALAGADLRFTTLPDDDPSLAFDFGPYEPVTGMDTSGVDYRTVLSRDDLATAAALVGRAAADAPLSFDTETTSVDSMNASLVGVSLAVAPEEAVYVPTPLPDGTRTADALAPLRAALEDDAIPKVGHNVKYDLVVLAREGVRVAGPLVDTMVLHYLLNPEASHKLDDVAAFYLNYRPQPITDLIGTGKNALSMRDVPIEQVGPYACEDADVALRLASVLTEKLRELDPRLLAIADEIEFPLIRVLADMERAGVKVDTAVLDDIRPGLEEQASTLQGQIYELAGRTFNIGSPKQLAEVLFNPPPTDEERARAATWSEEMVDPKAAGKTKKQLAGEAPTFGLGLKPMGKTATGQYKTDELVLAELAKEHPLPAMVVDWRKVTKLINTYVDALPELIHPETRRLHTDFNQTKAETGRLSSQNPNLQNIPIRTDLGREIRRAFVAEPGHVLLSADYAQIELRLLAHMSGDEALIEAFREGRDIHTATAATVYGIPDAEVTRGQRDRVKQVNYGIPYGISAFGLAQRMRVSNSEAQELITRYKTSYPRVTAFLDEVLDEARRTGYVETLFGRRRYVPQITSRNPNDRAFAERIAVNMPIQGTQADMIKKAMIAIHARLGAEDLRARMILQVHDELVFEVPEAEVEAVTALVTEEMQAALPLSVPVEVGVGVAPNWLDAH